MSDEDRGMNFMRGIGDRPTFKVPSEKSKDVKYRIALLRQKKNVRKEAST